MFFNSYFFILIFLPVTVLGYYVLLNIRKYKSAKIFLTFMSLCFYAYANVSMLSVIIGSICFNYVIYILMKKSRWCRLFLTIAILTDLGILFYFKYYNFFIDNVNLILKTQLSILEIVLPLGISFMTFQQISFVVDVYKGRVEECNFIEYALFVSFFPHLMSGPIITYHDFVPLLKDNCRKKVNWDALAGGIYMFVMGLGKKVLIADVLARGVDCGYNSLTQLNTTSAVFISFLYTFQIYFDFSGYSDMAIGLSRMLNLDLPVNFSSPYKARTIIEFWDRWHMTLTAFFTRYLYIPLGGSRKGKMRTWINTMIVFVCSGFWHGASWTFIFWGFLHGLFLTFTKRFRSSIERLPNILNWIVTMIFVNTTWILFRAESFSKFRTMCGVLFSNNWGALNADICDSFQNFLWGWIPGLPYWGGACGYLIVSAVLVFKCKNVKEKAETFGFSWQSIIYTVIIMILSILSFSSVTTYVYANF